MVHGVERLLFFPFSQLFFSFSLAFFFFSQLFFSFFLAFFPFSQFFFSFSLIFLAFSMIAIGISGQKRYLCQRNVLPHICGNRYCHEPLLPSTLISYEPSI